jgi:hypothetical protein
MPKEQFKQEVEKELTGKESEPSEIIADGLRSAGYNATHVRDYSMQKVF